MSPFVLLPWLAAAVAIPPENLQKGVMPPIDPANAMAERLLAAIVAGDETRAEAEFFPAEPFDSLKDLPKPHDYYEQLIKWFAADVHKGHERVKALGHLAFDGFHAGTCKWKAIGTEYNKIAYWSCYRNEFYGKSDGGKRVTFPVRAMINWGKTWYVTHLSPPAAP